MRRRGRGQWRATSGLLATPTIWLVVFFVVPVVMVGLYSVGLLTLLRNDDYLSLEHWRFFLDERHVPRVLFWKSVRMSLGVSITAVLLAYPVAYLLALIAGTRKYTLLLVIIVPFLTSYLLRVLAWRVILGESGVRELVPADCSGSSMSRCGGSSTVSSRSTSCCRTCGCRSWRCRSSSRSRTSTMHLLEASSDLGASRLRTFWTVTLPLSLPGVVAGFIFVFIPTIGEYVTPQLVGGPGGFMFGSAIQSAFTAGLDWQFGSAMAMFLIFAVAVLLVVFGRFLDVRSVAE